MRSFESVSVMKVYFSNEVMAFFLLWTAKIAIEGFDKFYPKSEMPFQKTVVLVN